MTKPQLSGYAAAPVLPQAAPALPGGRPQTQCIGLVTLAGYPQQICGQLDLLWITHGEQGAIGGDRRVAVVGAR